MKTRAATLVSAALLLGALAGAGGCADNRASISVQMICTPTEDCAFAPTCDTQALGPAVYDRTTAGGALVLFLQVANQLPNNADLATGRVNTNDAHVDEIVTELEGAVAGVVSVGINTYVPAGGTAVVETIIPIPLGLDGEALANVRLRGYYDHGDRFETGEFPVTVLLCSGCLGATCGGLGACPQEGQYPVKCPE